MGFDEARFREVESDLRILAGHLGAAHLTVIPVSATLGDNVVHRSTTTPWYAGPTLLEYLESVELAAPSANTAQLRLPVQWVARPTEGRRRR